MKKLYIVAKSNTVEGKEIAIMEIYEKFVIYFDLFNHAVFNVPFTEFAKNYTILSKIVRINDIK